MIKTIPLSKLVPSPRNVRRRSDEQADAELKADIEARGLLQNLVVTAASKRRGCFEVEAGGRRLKALKSLAGEGKLAKSHEVACLLLEAGAGQAEEVSLAENFQRLAMNPADECTAFRQLIEQGADIAAVAHRFGLSERFVEGRLRLASLAPAIFAALGAAEISLDVAQAYAAVPDHERQTYVFEQIGRGYGGAHPDTIRRMMIQASISGTDRRAMFVGADAYAAAGGRIERDLFGEEGERWLDVLLLDRLALEKLEPLAAEAAVDTGLGWVRPTLERWAGYFDTDGLRRLTFETALLSEEERETVTALNEEAEALAASIDSDDIDQAGREQAMARVHAIDEQLEAILLKAPVVEEALKPKLGAFLIIDDRGRPMLDHGRYASLADEAEPAGSDGSSAGSSAAVAKPVLTQRLADELSMQRRDILAVHIAADPRFANDLAAFLMADRQMGFSGGRTGFTLHPSAPSDPVVGFRTPEALATLRAAAAADLLDRSWMEAPTVAERFDSFRRLDEDARAAWMAHAVARTLEASLNLDGARRCDFHDHLGNLLGIETASWWRPTAANYFDRVPKKLAIAALEEIGGPAVASVHSGAKKAQLAEACEHIFAGDFIAEAEVKQAALAWVPEAMRFAATPDGGDGDTPAGEAPVAAEDAGGAEAGKLDPDAVTPIAAALAA